MQPLVFRKSSTGFELSDGLRTLVLPNALVFFVVDKPCDDSWRFTYINIILLNLDKPSKQISINMRNCLGRHAY